MDEHKNIIGYIVETDPCKDCRTMCMESRYLFQTKIMAYRYILKLVDKVRAEYRRILDSGYEEIVYSSYINREIDEEKSVPLDDAYTYSISTTIHPALGGYENIYVTLKRRTEADLSDIVPYILDSPDPLGLLSPDMLKSDEPQYFSEPIRTTTIRLIPVCSKSEEDIVQDLEVTATAEDAVNFVRKHAVTTIKLPGQPRMEFTYASNTEEEYDP